MYFSAADNVFETSPYELFFFFFKLKSKYNLSTDFNQSLALFYLETFYAAPVAL